MKKYFFLVVIASVILFSCSKEKEINPATPSSQLMTELKFTSSKLTMTYDNQGRIQTIHRDVPPYVYDQEFTYSPGKVFHKTYFKGKVSTLGEYTMVNGKATAHDWQEFDLNGNLLSSHHDKYTYDAKGQLEKRVYTNGAYWLYTFNNDGNISNTVYYDGNGQMVYRSEYEYGNTLNKFPYLTDNNNFGELFFVPGYSKHMRKTMRSFDLPGDIKNYEVKYDYQLNEGGYPVQTTGTEIFPSNNQWSFTAKFQ